MSPVLAAVDLSLDLPWWIWLLPLGAILGLVAVAWALALAHPIGHREASRAQVRVWGIIVLGEVVLLGAGVTNFVLNDEVAPLLWSAVPLLLSVALFTASRLTENEASPTRTRAGHPSLTPRRPEDGGSSCKHDRS